MYTQQDVLEFVQEEDVKFIRLAFFDLAGKQKNISIMASELHRAFKFGVSFDASAIEGFESPDRSELFLHPDPSTISVLPWRPSNGKVVRMFCDIRYADGKPYEKDCRNILKKAVEYAEKKGVKFMFGTELEFYLFKLDADGNPTKTPFDNAGYMDVAPEDRGENIRREICFTLEQMGIKPEASHHEEGPGQNEIDFHYSTPITAADNTVTFKWIVKTKASSNGLYADFSPKPIANQPGTGMHINMSCNKVGEMQESAELMPYALAGVLNHIAEMTYYLNPVEDSYNRLGGCKAPKYISWAKGNRSQLIRIPDSKEIMRFEVRSPDAMCNPYLAFTLLIYAAMDGIENKLPLPESVEENLQALDENLAKNLGKLPDTVEAAKEASDCGFINSIFTWTK